MSHRALQSHRPQVKSSQVAFNEPVSIQSHKFYNNMSMPNERIERNIQCEMRGHVTGLLLPNIYASMLAAAHARA